MSKSLNFTLTVVAGAAFCFPLPLLAESAPQKIDLTTAPAEVVDEVIIPIPQEIFVSLDKLGQHNWRQELRKKDTALDDNRSRTAMLFGLVISEGFIAVQAEDTDEVKRIGRDVLKLAGALGVKSTVVTHAQSIIDNANTGNWPEVRRELDRTRQTVVDTMENLQDHDFAELVSLGGWLGGTQALASLLSKDYSEEGSELLHQPDLVERIHRRYVAIPAKNREGALFENVSTTLTRLQTLMKTGTDGLVGRDEVNEINVLTSSLTEQVYGN